jgi:hypothetical protein
MTRAMYDHVKDLFAGFLQDSLLSDAANVLHQTWSENQDMRQHLA